MTAAEHLAWCKQRARSYAQAGKLDDAVRNMVLDLQRHHDTATLATIVMMQRGLTCAAQEQRNTVLAWIEAFTLTP